LVKVESSEGIATITMTRADKRNALTQALCDELYEAYRGFEEGGDQVAILQADGPAFCVGADLKEPPAAMWKAVPHVSHKLTKPVIAATQGWVIGGAICMVMTCDLMVSADTTRFMYPEAKVGVFGGLMPGIVSRMPHKVAMELLLLGEEISVKRAYDVGFVNKVVPLGEERAEAHAARLRQPDLAARPGRDLRARALQARAHRRQRGSQGGRGRLPREAAGEIQRQVRTAPWASCCWSVAARWAAPCWRAGWRAASA
jgi:enoyl-CoA hydratase/carnithine racemase